MLSKTSVCPAAAFTRNALPEIQRLYVRTGKVELVFRHFPLEQIHKQALEAAEASECASRQGHFWQMHDALFLDQPRLSHDAIMRDASVAGLDSMRFSHCVEDPAVLDRVRQDATTARALGVRGTPSFFLGDRQTNGQVKAFLAFYGARPLADFTRAIDQHLGS